MRCGWYTLDSSSSNFRREMSQYKAMAMEQSGKLRRRSTLQLNLRARVISFAVWDLSYARLICGIRKLNVS